MFYEITTVIGCHNNCSYCPQKKLIANYNKYSNILTPSILSLKNFKKIIDKIPFDIEINFAGFSEPFQNPDCVDMAIYAHKKGHIVRIYTTLNYLTPNLLIKLINNVPFDNQGESRFVVHLPSKSEYKRVATDKEYLKTLKTLIKSKINVAFSYLGDEKLPLKIESLFKKHHIHVHYSQLISRAGNIDIQNVVIPSVKTYKIKCENRSNGTRGHIVLPDGRVAICCMDYGLDHILGNLLTDTFESIENGNEFKKILRGLNNPKNKILCRHCELATNTEDPSVIIIKKDSYWQKTKIKIKKILQHHSPKLLIILQKTKELIIPFRVSDIKKR
jgi:hypothetical protein